MQRTSNWVPGKGPVMGEIDRLYREARAQAIRLQAENERLRAKNEELSLALIECRNPGIDMDEVRRSRAATFEEKRHAAQSDR